MPLYILHGENELQRTEARRDLAARSGLTADLRDVNTATLTAPLTAAEVKRTCSTIPFLGDVRLVVVRGALSQKDRAVVKAIAAYLPDLPPTTWLIFDEEKTLPASNPVLKAVKKLGGEVRHFALPKPKALAGWIRQRAKDQGGSIEPAAAALLAQHIGVQLRILDQELRKLRLYCDDRPITRRDVQTLVPYVQSADVIFKLVDALGQREPRHAARYLHQLLATGSPPLMILGMIVRQFRLLVQVRWLLDEGTPPQALASRLKIHPYVAGKLRSQAMYFTPEQLRHAYDLLLQSDVAIKQGRLTPEAALDLLIVQLTGG